jgi:hypothetical protein
MPTRAGSSVKDAATGEALRRNPDHILPSASLYEPFFLRTVQDVIGAGELARRHPADPSAATDDSAQDGYLLGAYGDTITVAETRRLPIATDNHNAAWLLAAAICDRAKIETSCATSASPLPRRIRSRRPPRRRSRASSKGS